MGREHPHPAARSARGRPPHEWGGELVPAFRDIVRRIDSIKNTQKITKAMQVVAATRQRKAQQAGQATRPYAEKMVRALQTPGEHDTEDKHPLLVPREGQRLVM